MKAATGPPQPPAQNYFVSFTDLLVGLLFIFIIVLVTYALTYRRAEEGFRQRLKGLEERIEMRSNLLRRLERNLRRQHIPATADVDQGVLRFRESVLFQRGRAELGPEAQRALRVLAAELATELPCYGRNFRPAACRNGGGAILEAVYVEGHTDDVDIHTRQFPSNWELSSARAIVTYNFLLHEAGVLSRLPNASGRATLLGASAYAETRPVRSRANHDENRRIDFRFLLAPPTSADVLGRTGD